MLAGLLREYARPYRSLVGIVAALQVISTLAALYLPTVNAAIIDDGVAKGDTQTIMRLGGVMLAVSALQVLCAVAAVPFGSRTGMGFGRDLRWAIFDHVTGFSAHETARFGVPVAVDPHHQRRPADPAAGSADVHDADHRADHVYRGNP